MFKRLLKRIYHGFSITMIVNLAVHLLVARLCGGCVTERFAARFPNISMAVIAQLLLVGLIGAAFAGAAQIFENERWSFFAQGAVHFLITAAVWMPIAWLCWSPVPKGAIWRVLGGWLLTYGITWAIQYFLWRKKVRELNRSIRRLQHEGD